MHPVVYSCISPFIKHALLHHLSIIHPSIYPHVLSIDLPCVHLSSVNHRSIKHPSPPTIYSRSYPSSYYATHSVPIHLSSTMFLSIHPSIYSYIPPFNKNFLIYHLSIISKSVYNSTNHSSIHLSTYLSSIPLPIRIHPSSHRHQSHFDVQAPRPPPPLYIRRRLSHPLICRNCYVSDGSDDCTVADGARAQLHVRRRSTPPKTHTSHPAYPHLPAPRFLWLIKGSRFNWSLFNANCSLCCKSVSARPSRSLLANCLGTFLVSTPIEVSCVVA